MNDQSSTEFEAPPVTVYLTALCPYCYMTTQLLNSKGVSFNKIDVTFKPALRAEMKDLAGGRTSVPQIWIGDRHVGGFQELEALEHDGHLDALLNGAGGVDNAEKPAD